MIDDDAGLRNVLQATRTIAVVGLSDNPTRPSHTTARYMQAQGYRIVPVNPTCTEVLGEPCHASLRDIPFPVDMVDVFRRAEEVPAVVEDAIAIGAPCVWLQLGVIHPEAAARAETAGLQVVMDRCVKIEHARLLVAPSA